MLRLNGVQGSPESVRAEPPGDRAPKGPNVAFGVVLKEVGVESACGVEDFGPVEGVAALGASGSAEAAQVVFAERTADFFGDVIPVGRVGWLGVGWVHARDILPRRGVSRPRQGPVGPSMVFAVAQEIGPPMFDGPTGSIAFGAFGNQRFANPLFGGLAVAADAAASVAFSKLGI